MPRASEAWAIRLYQAVPLDPSWLGILFAALLVTLFFGSELAMGRISLLAAAPDPLAELRNVRLTVIHCLLTAYVPTAYALLILRSRRTFAELRPVLEASPSLDAAAANIGRYPWWTLAIAGAIGSAISIQVTLDTTDGNPWAWSALGPEVVWHRVLGLIFTWWIGCFLFATVVESLRLSSLADRLARIDLLDLRPLAPFTRQGLTNALLAIGLASFISLFTIEPGYSWIVALTWLSTAWIAWAALLLPLRGLRRRIRKAKQAELDWCRAALERERDALKAGTPGARLDQVIAYRDLVQQVREWPFDNPSLLRFALYLLIPLGSWAGGALVERLIDSLLR